MRRANPVAYNPSKATEFCIIVLYTFENLAENQSTVYQGQIAVLATLRDRLRGSDIWVAGSREYRVL